MSKMSEATSDASSETSSFYYTAKASRSDRNEGLDSGQKGTYEPGVLCMRDDLSDEDREAVYNAFPEYTPESFPDTMPDKHVPGPVRKFFRQVRKGERGNMHVTVKPVALMRWLVRLVCPPGGVVLDPYAGSGTTLVAAAEEGMHFVGIEIDPAYHTIAEKRATSVAVKRDVRKTEESIFDLLMTLDD
jgi:DNA modification methylase